MVNEHEKLLIIDFGGPEKTSVARQVRGSMVYSEVAGPSITADEIRDKGYRAIIMCGRPTAEHMAAGGSRPGIPFDKTIADLDLPILAFGFAGRVLTQLKRGQVAIPGDSEKGAWDAPAEKQTLKKVQDAPMLMGLPDEFEILTSSPYFIKTVPEGFTVLMGTEQMPNAFSGDLEKGHYIADFQTRLPERILRLIVGNFLCMVSQFRGDWDMQHYMVHAIDELKEKCKGKRALLALSGGVDSAVVAMLAHKALGPRLHAVFVDHGLMRLNEGDWIEDIFKNQMGLNLVRINAEDRFLGKLAGVHDPEKKRKIIGEEFIRVFEEEARKADCDILLQGTIYPDVIESGIGGHKVKSHHNVGGLPEDIKFEAVLEPLRPLYKDEVRQLGMLLGLPSKLVHRQPFPGPGLGVRCLGEVKKEKLEILRQADHIFREELEKAGLDKEIGQYFAAIMDTRAVGTSKTGERTFNETIALRAVNTTDYMEAEFTKVPWEVLERCSTRIYDEVEGVGRVLYDISSKPPATIEFE